MTYIKTAVKSNFWWAMYTNGKGGLVLYGDIHGGIQTKEFDTRASMRRWVNNEVHSSHKK